MLHALDISTRDLEYVVVVEITKPKIEILDLNNSQTVFHWEVLKVKVWEGGLQTFNPEFVGMEFIVSTEVCVL